VSDLQTTLADGGVELQLDAGAFPRDAVYAAAYAFTDRCYVRLDQPTAGRIGISLRPKTAGSLDGAAAAAELTNELHAHAWRERIADEGRELTTSIAAGAFGGMRGPDDFDATEGADGAAFDDPLGIALSWEAQQQADKVPDQGEQGT
jgi:His-Xaa-Ser system protein HxsD